MTRIVSSNDMGNVRRSLAEAGIYFDKLYINQAYFNSNFTIQSSEKNKKFTKPGFWKKLLCGSVTKRTSTGTQTILKVRDEYQQIQPNVTSRQRIPPTETTYDYRRYRPLNREYTYKKSQQPIRRRRSSLLTRSVHIQRQKKINDDDDDDDDDDESNEFAV